MAIYTNQIIKSQLSNYSNKNDKIKRDIKANKLIRLKRGMYENSMVASKFVIASNLYGPSYLSFDYALYYYGLIPEKVVTYTSATYDKKKKKQFDTPFGVFTYRDVPKNVYFIGVRLAYDKDEPFQIASPEKALCDKLYTLKPLKNISEMEDLLFNDLRIDISDLAKLDVNFLKILSDNYHCTNVTLLYKFLRRCAS